MCVTIPLLPCPECLLGLIFLYHGLHCLLAPVPFLCCRPLCLADTAHLATLRCRCAMSVSPRVRVVLSSLQGRGSLEPTRVVRARLRAVPLWLHDHQAAVNPRWPSFVTRLQWDTVQSSWSIMWSEEPTTVWEGNTWNGSSVVTVRGPSSCAPSPNIVLAPACSQNHSL